jgi:hypothetical protein
MTAGPVMAGLPAASDEDLRAAVADAELPPLLAALAHLTGKDDWPQYFSTGDILLDYFRLFAAEHEITEHIRFGSEVVSLKFDEDTCTWAVYLERIFAGRPDLLEAAVPGYPPGAKRMLRDNGACWRAGTASSVNAAPDLHDYQLL